MMNNDKSILTEKEKYTQALLAKETEKANKISATNIYKYLTSNLSQFKQMHKDMGHFEKEFIGHTIGAKLLEASNAYMTAYQSTNRDEKIKFLKIALFRMEEISNFLKLGFSTNAFIERTFNKFFEKHILTKNAIVAFLNSQLITKQQEDEKLLEITKSYAVTTPSEQTS